MFRPHALILALLLSLLPVETLAAARCDVTFAMTEAVPWSTLRFRIDYPQAEVSFDRTESAVACAGLDGVVSSFADDGAGIVLGAIASLGGAHGPGELVRCAITAAEPPAPAAFAITVLDGTDRRRRALERLPELAATGVECSERTATAVLGEQTPTTMQLEASTTTMPLDALCTVDFRMTSSQTIGAVQFSTDYAAADGGSFEGLGPAVLCTGLVTDALHSFNDIEASFRLRTSIIKLNGFAGPADLSTCSFVPVGTLPTVADFVITVVDASTPESQPVVPFPTVEVSAVACLGATTTSTTTTSTTSTTLPVCGDGILQVFEECDDGLANSDAAPDACRTDCTAARCGDSVADSGEQCDQGPANSDVTADACRTDCTAARCGDSVADSGEQCDQGPANSDVTADACRTDCTAARCGDSVADSGEQCDQGPANSDVTADACRTDCTAARCGDSVADSGEQCDQGPANSDVTADACRTDCTAARCGDSVADSGEQCDQGPANSDVTADACRTDCTAARCGDSVADSGEQCDEGPANSDVAPDACRTDCSLAGCGDAFIDTDEECDDGASNSNADPGVCRRDCSLPYRCGDANDSGAVNVSDAQWILAFAVGAIDLCELGLCDTTGDGRVTASDAQRALFEAVALPVELRCTLPVRLGVVEPMVLGSLSFEVHYGATDSSFLGSGTAVACVGLLPEATVTFDNDAEADTLRVTASSLAGIGGPVDVAECQFRERDDLPPPEAFTPQVTSATDLDGAPVSPPSIALRF